MKNVHVSNITMPMFMFYLYDEATVVGPDTWAEAVSGRSFFKDFPWKIEQEMEVAQSLEITFKNEEQLLLDAQEQRLLTALQYMDDMVERELAHRL